MNIIEDEKSLLALEFKQMYYIEPRTMEIKKRLNEIMNFFIKTYEPALYRKLTGVSRSDKTIIESTFRYELLYGLLKWKAKSPVGGYIALCLKSVMRQFLIEKSPVHRQCVKGSVSYDLIAEQISNQEDRLGDNFRQYEIDLEYVSDNFTVEQELEFNKKEKDSSEIDEFVEYE